MDLRLSFKAGDIAKVEREFRYIKGGAEKAMVSTINRVLPGMRKDAVEEVTGVYTAKATAVRNTMRIDKARPGRIEGKIVSTGGAIRDYQFKVTPRKVTKKRPKGGVKVQVRKDKGGVVKGSFIAKMRSGHVGVFKRIGSTRKINELFGPAVPSMLKDEGAYTRVQQRADARLSKELDAQIDRILRGVGS